MTISHTGIIVPAAQHQAVVEWYEAALAPLGYKKAVSYLDNLVVGFADASGMDWWVTSAAAAPKGQGDAEAKSIVANHTAFSAKGMCLRLVLLSRFSHPEITPSLWTVRLRSDHGDNSERRMERRIGRFQR